MPSLTVNNLQASIDFFTGLGFEVEDRWEDKGVMLGAMLKAGDARLGLSQDDGKKGTDRQKGIGMRLYIEAASDIDQIAARAKAVGYCAGQRAARHGVGRARLRSGGPDRFPVHHRLAVIAGEVIDPLCRRGCGRVDRASR